MSVAKRSTVAGSALDVARAHETASDTSFLSFARVLEHARTADPALRLHPALGTAMQWAELCAAKAVAAQSRTYVDPLAPDGAEDPDDWDQQADATAWTTEARTWVLIALLTAERHARRQHMPAGDPAVGNPYAAPAARALAVVQNDAALSEMRVVRDWLQSHVLPIAHPVEMRKGYWPATKNGLRAARRTGLRSRAAPTSQEKVSLDPDLPARAGQLGASALDPQDAQYDKAASRYLFEAVRNGRLDLCLDVTKAMNHSWKAASLRGSLLYARANADDTQPSLGNRNRFLWKTVCRKLANDISTDPFERALYGVLGGNVNSVLSVSHSWEEQLWAFVYTSFESKLDVALADGTANEPELGQSDWGLGTGQVDAAAVAGIPADDAIEGLAAMSLRQVFERLEQTDTDRISLQAKDPFRTFQRDFILHDLDSLLLAAETRLPNARATMTRGQYARLVRFFSHYVLFTRLADPEAESVRQAHLSSGQPAAATTLATNSILRAYVELLEEAGQGDDLVALYASSLDRTNAIDSYAQYLRSLDPLVGDSVRWSALRQADDHQLDLPAVAQRTTQLILDEAIPALGSLLASDLSLVRIDLPVNEVETRLITSLTWLAFSRETWTDYVVEANHVLRLFLAGGRVHAARRLVLELSPDIVAAALGSEGALDLDLPEDQAKEHFGYHLLNSFYHTTDVFHDLWAHRSEQAAQTRTALSQWAQQVGFSVDAVYKAALDLLKEHWLELPPGIADQQRAQLLLRIRSVYIPDIVLRLHGLFVDTRQVVPHSLERALKLPNLVVDEEYRLYAEFLAGSGNRLRPYLSLVREAALLQLDQSQVPGQAGDPFSAAGFVDPLEEQDDALNGADGDSDQSEVSVIDLIPDE